MKTILSLLLAAGLGLALHAQNDSQTDSEGGFVQLNSSLSYQMLEGNQDLRKVSILLDALNGGQLKPGNLYVGASIVAIADYQKSNTDSKFAYLMRHPTANNEVGESVSEAVLHTVQLGLTAPINSWLTGYAEVLYDPEQSFGAGTITALGRNQLQLRKGYVLVGNLDKFPVYLALGKMDGPYGQTNSVSPFTNSTMWHAFGTLGFGALVGFNSGGFDASFMAVQGGAQFRALNAPVEGTSVPSRLNNFIADANYTLTFGSNSSFTFGGSYVHGTNYCQEWPIAHFQPCDENNPASSFYGRLNLGDQFMLKGAFSKTKNVWPGTHNPNAPLDQYAASKVSSLDAGAKYVFNPNSSVVYALSGEFSNFVAGDDGAPWERQNQLVFGFSAFMNNSAMLFAEVFNTQGYSPLNFISGGDDPDNPGTTHSVRDATSFGIVLGGRLTL